MIVNNIVKPNFSGELGRVDYFLMCLSIFGVYFVGALVVGGVFGVIDSMNLAESANTGLSAIVGLLVFFGIMWMVVVSISILVKRFRNMGMTEISTLWFACIGYFIVNAFFPLISLLPLFWPPADKEAV